LTVEPNRDQQHLPGPSIWPIGFAIGVACMLVGIVVSWIVLAVGAAIAVLCAALWVRDASRGPAAPAEATFAAPPAPAAPVTAPPVPADTGEPALPVMEDEEIERYPRSVFLEGATLGIGALIGGILIVPTVGFMVAPAFVNQHPKSVDLGPISNFPEGQFVIATFLRNALQGEVSRRSAYVRYNGIANNVPSFTIISNRCAHLGCPVQPNGPVFDNKTKQVPSGHGIPIKLIPTIPAGGFGCPCHGGQYDQEGNRTAGPPVRALDRYEFEIRNGHLVLLGNFSVRKVVGTGAAAKIYKTVLSGPGQHVDGPEQWLYPVQPPH
jgi:menaquinol-cytochrome c reductase iron-sulfur subunit